MTTKEMYKIFIIGLGNQGMAHARSLYSHPQSHIVGGYDSEQRARENFKHQFKFPIYDNLQEGLQSTDPHCIVIATPPYVRLTLFDAFQHLPSLRTIIIEKPLALSIKDAETIYDVCLKKNWQVIVVHQSRFAEEFIRLKHSIAAGRLGKIEFLKSSHYGNVFNQGSHAIDLLRWILQEERVHWVDATGNNDINQIASLKSDVNQTAIDNDHPGHLWSTIYLRFASGVECVMTAGILDLNPKPLLGPWMQRRILAVGEKGMAESQLASHFKEMLADAPVTEYLTSPENYSKALQAFYTHVFHALDNRMILQTKENNLHTLSIMIAIYASATLKQIIAIPSEKDLIFLDDYLKQHTKAHFQQLPVISIIIPMETHRGIGEEAVLSWIQGQTCDSALYEVIIVCHHTQTYFQKKLSNKLRPQDQLVFIEAQNEIQLSHHGATLAKGHYLLFTESHCIAEMDAIEQALLFFKKENYAGFYPRTIHLYKNALGQLEAKFYEQNFLEFNNPNYWSKVVLHAFGIKKEAYFAAGGFEYRYNRFSYWLLGANLYRKGFYLGYAAAVCVKHQFASRFDDIDIFLDDCVIGECLYRSETSNEEFCQFFTSHKEWNITRGFDPIIALFLLKMIIRYYLFRGDNQYQLNKFMFIKKEFLKNLFYYVFKKQAVLQPYHLLKQLSRLRFYLSKHLEKKWQYFVDYQNYYSAWQRAKCALSFKKNSEFHFSSEYHFSLTEIKDEFLYNIFSPEKHENYFFRWGKPICAIKLNVLPQSYRITLHILTLRRITNVDDILFFIGDYPIQDIELHTTHEQLTFSIPKMKFPNQPWLFIITKPWNNTVSEGDQRQLGLAIRSIHLQAV